MLWGWLSKNHTHSQRHMWAIGNTNNTRTYNCHTLKNTWCDTINMSRSCHAQTVSSNMCTCITQNNTSVDWQVTLKINQLGHIYWNLHKEPQCSLKRNKWALLIHWHQNSPALMHWYTCTFNCLTGRSYLCKHKDLLCTLKRNNCKLLISWRVEDRYTTAHTYGSTHKEIDTPAARKQRDSMSPTAVDSCKCKDRGRME